jgi:hypothetical protein
MVTDESGLSVSGAHEDPMSSWLPDSSSLAPILELLELLELLVLLTYPRLIFGRRDSLREIHSPQGMRWLPDLDSDLRISVPPTSGPVVFVPVV